MATQIDGSRSDVDVHEVIHDTTLNVILDPVYEVPGSHVKDLNEGEVPTKEKGGRQEVSQQKRPRKKYL